MAKDLPLIGPNDATSTRLVLDEVIGSDSWEIGTHVGFIDVYAVNREPGVAIVLENKIAHVLNNPLGSYAARARSDGFPSVVVFVLAPVSREHLEPAQQRYVSATIAYAGLSEEIKRSPELIGFLLAPRDLDQRRSLELLQQFHRSAERRHRHDNLDNEAKWLEECRNIIETHGASIRPSRRHGVRSVV